MKIYRFYAQFNGVRENEEFEFDDDTPESEIDEAAKDYAFRHFDWGFYEITEGERKDV